MNEKIKALPTQLDYTAAAELCSEEFQVKGGPWAAMYGYEKFGQHRPTALAILIRSGRLARLIEPIDDDLEPVDPLMRTTHAYKLGSIAGIRLTEIVHDVPVSPDQMFVSVGNRLEDEVGEPSEFSDSIITNTLLNIGGEGMKFAGQNVVEIVDRWGADVVSDARVRRMFRLGCGAMIYAAHTIRDDYNQMHLKRHFSSSKWLDEFDQLLVSDTGE